MNTVKLLDFGAKILKYNKIASYRLDSEVILSNILNIPRVNLLSKEYNVSDKKITNIHIQNPKIGLDNFDAIVAPEHDNLKGEILDLEKKYKYLKNDFIVARAVGSLDKFYPLIQKNISSNSFNDMNNGLIYLKGGDLSHELRQIKHYKEVLISDYFNEPFFKDKKIISYK